jgi:hypothetical protein
MKYEIVNEIQLLENCLLKNRDCIQEVRALVGVDLE